MAIALRPLAAADLDQVYLVNRQIEIHDQLPLVTSRAEFEDWLAEPHFDLAADARVAEGVGTLVGFARVWHRASGEREERAYLLGGVHPDFRRRGIGTALFGWQLARATEKVHATGKGLPRFVRTQAYDFETSAIALYERHGLVPIRYQDELLRPLEHPSPAVSVVGIDISGWEPQRSEEGRALHNEAFADHWGSTPRDRESWGHLLSSTGVRLDLSFIATDAERLVGLALNAHYPDDQALTGRRDGWIFQLAVLRSHRRRGIASALIAASLEAFRQAGFTHAALGVDSENPTGAYRLYEGLGFRRMTRSIVHQLEV